MESEKNNAMIPGISAFTDTVFAGETVALTGENLENVRIEVAAGDLKLSITPLRSAKQKLLFEVPGECGRSTFAFRAVNEYGASEWKTVNKPTVWWIYQDTREDEIRIYGRGLALGIPGVFVVSGEESEKLEVLDSSLYHIRARLGKLYGKVRLNISNGSDPKLGSVSYEFEISKRESAELPIINVDDFGAKQGTDSSDAVRAALDEAGKLGGAVIRFGEGEYNFAKAIEVDGKYPRGLVIKGAGRGEYDFSSGLSPEEYGHRGLSGKFTSIRFMNGITNALDAPENTIRVRADNVTIKDMTIFGADGQVNGYSMQFGYTVTVGGKNISVENVRMIKADLRDLNRADNAWLMCSNNLEIAEYSENVRVKNCEFHTKSCGLSIGSVKEFDCWQYCDSSRTVRNVLVSDCEFIGYAADYTHPSGKKPLFSDYPEISRGITAMNIDGVIIENNEFRSYDRDGGKWLVRSMYIVEGAANVVISGNHIHDIASGGNNAEQILFHGAWDKGGIFDVKRSDGKILTLRNDNIRTRNSDGSVIRPQSTTTADGSVIPISMISGRVGKAYICRGKGAGQVRDIESYSIRGRENILTLSGEWDIEPDETSVCNLNTFFSHNLVFRNHIHNDKQILERYKKNGGVLFFFDSYDNVIAENRIGNLAFGIVLNSGFKVPSVWNTVRDNRLSGIREVCKDAEQGGDTTYNSTFLCESVISNVHEGGTYSWSQDSYRGWYTVGNAFRGNICENGDVAMEITTNRWFRENGWDRFFGGDKGLTMTVAENNVFRNVAEGILVGNPANWTLIRNNSFSFVKKDGYSREKVCFEQDESNYDLMIEE